MKAAGGPSTSGALTVTAPTGEVILETPVLSSTERATVTAPAVDYFTGTTNRTFTITSTASQRMNGYIIFEW